mmetsp:Transcript_48518/g.122479  ORF Transcript_48518/g.122479 Transcript_48518/m.122479 type:complete len:197 (+) Transcript_48518:348-938(+)
MVTYAARLIAASGRRVPASVRRASKALRGPCWRRPTLIARSQRQAVAGCSSSRSDEGSIEAMARSGRWEAAAAALQQRQAAGGHAPAERTVTAVFEALETEQQSDRALQLLADLVAVGASPASLSGAYNCTARCLARQPGGLRAALETLRTMVALEEVGALYETFNVVAQACQGAGLPEQAEAVMQVRYSMYHSSD